MTEFINKSGLEKKEKDILQKYFWGGSTLKEIGVEYHVTRERIRQIISRAVTKIRDKIELEGIRVEDFFEIV